MDINDIGLPEQALSGVCYLEKDGEPLLDENGDKIGFEFHGRDSREYMRAELAIYRAGAKLKEETDGKDSDEALLDTIEHNRWVDLTLLCSMFKRVHGDLKVDGKKITQANCAKVFNRLPKEMFTKLAEYVKAEDSFAVKL